MFDEKVTDYHVFPPNVQRQCNGPVFSAGHWPMPDRVRIACEIVLQRLGDLPPIWETALDQNLAYASFDQKMVYLERRSYLQSHREACESWLKAIHSSFAVPNEMSGACQQLLYIIDWHLQGLHWWLQTLPEYDQQELTGTTPPNQEEGEFEHEPESEQDGRLENLRRRYRQHREEVIDSKMVEELKDDNWRY